MKIDLEKVNLKNKFSIGRLDSYYYELALKQRHFVGRRRSGIEKILFLQCQSALNDGTDLS